MNESRYIRQLQLDSVGTEGQERLGRARVLVVGAGGLGCPVLHYLAAAGVGTLGVADADTVSMSNLHRQLLFDPEDTGKLKVHVVARKLRHFNSEVEIIPYPFFLSAENAEELFASYDIIVDATDDLPTRYIINDAAYLTGKPWVFAGLYKHEGQIAVFNHKGSATYRCLFPEPPPLQSLPTCNQTGILGVVPGILGVMQANEVLKLLIGFGDPLVNTLLTLDTRTMRQQQISIIPKAYTHEEIQSALRQNHRKQTGSPELLSLDEVMNRENICIVDVRETHEIPNLKEFATMQLNLHTIMNEVTHLPKEEPKVFYCQSGTRARIAAEWLLKQGYVNCFVLKEQAEEIQELLEQRTYGEEI